MILLEIFIRIKKTAAAWMPHSGMMIAPVINVPVEAPVRSAARHADAGLLFSPIIRVARGNWKPQMNEKAKQ